MLPKVNNNKINNNIIKKNDDENEDSDEENMTIEISEIYFSLSIRDIEISGLKSNFKECIKIIIKKNWKKIL